MVVICASNEMTHARTDATKKTFFIPVLPADLPDITHSTPDAVELVAYALVRAASALVPTHVREAPNGP